MGDVMMGTMPRKQRIPNLVAISVVVNLVTPSIYLGTPLIIHLVIPMKLSITTKLLK
jgi:hypothetical protein